MKLKSGRYIIEISNSDKILFGISAITKNDLIRYYDFIAPIMLPHVKNRPISMQRFPSGIDHEGFFQKDAGDYFPSWITRVAIPKQEGGIVNYVVIDKPATLIYLANQGCITPHVWLNRIDNLEKPDRMIFDLDPADALSFKYVQRAAKKLKKILDDCSLPSFCMLTGSRGAHIVVPLKRVHTFDDTRDFAYNVAFLLAQYYPDLVTIDIHKSDRGNRVFIDWLRNGFGSTVVAPYAVRAREKAPVAMPVTWQELLSSGMSSQKYTIANVKNRISTIGDVWHDIQQHIVILKKARDKINTMLE
ncbi:MAG TPA: non-homologous end-joining DNA ligase [Candidatus Babeliales bacterium]|nr:non-homologous end-joining DNA ligase [Candidatus Babeliales bacterium]